MIMNVLLPYLRKLIDSARFMTTLLSNLVLINIQKEFKKVNVKVLNIFLNMKCQGYFDKI